MAVDLVKVLNVDSKPFNGKWDNAVWRIDPGSETLVPKGAANLWFGDGALVDTLKRRDRSLAYDRLRSRYGAYERDDIWEANKPNVEVYDLDGNRVWTIIEDPEGNTLVNASGPLDPSRRRGDDLEHQLKDMQRQMDALQRAIADQEQVKQGLGVGTTAPPRPRQGLAEQGVYQPIDADPSGPGYVADADDAGGLPGAENDLSEPVMETPESLSDVPEDKATGPSAGPRPTSNRVVVEPDAI